jgi:phenylacetate-CoA ligase
MYLSLLSKNPLWLIKRFFSAILRPVPFRYGTEFFNTYQLLQRTEKWNEIELRTYQLQQLQQILFEAFENTTFYRERFKSMGILPNNLKSLDDIRLFPFTDKSDLKNNLNQMVSLKYPKNHQIYVTTGGTTGEPVGLYLHRSTEARRLAFEWRQFNWGGYSWRDRCVVLRGRIIKDDYIQYDPVDHYLYLSVFDLNAKNFENYLDAINKFKPKIMRAYPSAAEALAKLILENAPNFNDGRWLKAVFTSSEILFAQQKSLIEEAFKAKVYDKYGNSEQATIIGTCETGKYYHDFQEYAFTEILDENGEPVIEDGGIGEIVSTPFTNPVTPLIRYRTGDLAQITFEKCPCGRELRRIKQIIGRSQDYLAAVDGSRISAAALNTHLDVFDHVKRFRYYQGKPGEAIIQIVKTPKFVQLDEQKILQESIYRSKGKIRFTIEYFDDLPLSSRGKFSFIYREHEEKIK